MYQLQRLQGNELSRRLSAVSASMIDEWWEYLERALLYNLYIL